MEMEMVERGIIGEFIGMWPSPREMAIWIQGNWQFLVKGQLTHYFFS